MWGASSSWGKEGCGLHRQCSNDTAEKSARLTQCRQLAEKHGGAERWGYRAVHCGQVDMYGILAKSKAPSSTDSSSNLDSISLQKRSEKAKRLLRAAGVPKELDWLAAEGLQSYDAMGDPSTTAQVHPYQFTTSMVQLAQEKGVSVLYGAATSINQEQPDGAVTSVSYTDKETGEEKQLPATTVILTAGPWTKSIYPAAPISALRAHSVTIRPSRPVSAYCLFTSIELPRDKSGRKAQTVTPEIYARPNNEVYACGEGDTLIPLPTSSDLVQVDQARCDDVVEQVCSISEELRDGEVTARQACYLPNVSSGRGPLVGETGVKGLLVGAGHTCWGIQNAPGTGKCLSELVWEGAVRSADLKSLDPRRVM